MGTKITRKVAKTQRKTQSSNGVSHFAVLAWRLGGFAGYVFLAYSSSMTENQLARIAVDASFKIHNEIGPGLLESVYEVVLADELERRGLYVIRQRPIPVIYEGTKLELGFRADIIVNCLLLLEVKSIDAIAPVHLKQVRTYLRLTDLKLGLLINFNVDLIKDGIRRVVNALPE